MNKLITLFIFAMISIPIASAGLFAPDIPPTSDGNLWQPIEKFKEFHPANYMAQTHNDQNYPIFYIVYKNQYDEYKYESVSITDYYRMNVTEKCRC